MLNVNVNLTNEEMQALEPRFSELDAQLTKKLTATEHQPHSRVALAYEAFRKLWSPIRQHLAALREPVQRGKP